MTSPLADRTRTPHMFSAIARRYDLLNHVLSFNVDRRWRRQLVDMANVREGDRVLDLATGTGDVAIEFARRTNAAEIRGADPSEGMLAVAREKIEQRNLGSRIQLVDASALRLPVADASFDIVTIAFGLRNLPDYDAGLQEMARVLVPGGRALVLEFFPPRNDFFLRAYRFYLGRILPVAGGIISGSPGAYRYLARSIEAFMTHEEMHGCLERAGFKGIEARRLTGGVAWIYRGTRANPVA